MNIAGIFNHYIRVKEFLFNKLYINKFYAILHRTDCIVLQLNDNLSQEKIVNDYDIFNASGFTIIL